MNLRRFGPADFRRGIRSRSRQHGVTLPPLADGLVMFLDPSAQYTTRNGSNLSGIVDRVGVTPSWSQVTASDQPLYAVADPEFGGHATFRCQSGDYLQGQASANYVHNASGSMIMMWVGRVNGSTPSTRILIDIFAGATGWMQMNGSGPISQAFRENGTFYPGGSTFAVDSPGLIISALDASAGEIVRCTGGAVSRVATTIQDITAEATTAPRINQLTNGGFGTADITTASLLLWNFGDSRAVTDDQINALVAWANSQWSL